MPLYEYECANDGTFELVRKFSDPPLTACPTCGGPVEKLASAPAIQFKGTGWYITDYARKSGGGGSGKDRPGESGKEKSGGDSGTEKSGTEKSAGSKESTGSTSTASASSGGASKTGSDKK